MTRIIDQASDPGYATLQVLMERFPKLREFSKQAELADEEFANLPDTAFAWPAQRKFPIHTREHAALSLGYVKTAGPLPVDVVDNLNRASFAYGIDDEVYVEQAVKVASSEMWLLKEKKRFRVASAKDVKMAEEGVKDQINTVTADILDHIEKMRQEAFVGDQGSIMV